MRRLLLLRHAKAEPGAPDQEDYDRALNARGLSDAGAMAQYLKRQAYVATRLLSSPSLRTRQTATAILDVQSMPIECLDGLYLAPPGKIIATIAAAGDEDACLLVVGHNPGLEQCAGILAREPVRRKEQERHDLLEEKFPTGALAVLDFDIAHWRKLSPCTGRLIDFIRPRDL